MSCPAPGPGDGKVLSGQAPAKINLYLEVLGRRPDGFHELLTVLQTIDLCDDLTVTLRDRREHIAPGEADITLDLAPLPATDSGPAHQVPSGPDNLVRRAASTLLAECGASGDVGLSLKLTKGIPAGGGLGGGSSDAALTLTLLNRLLGGPLAASKLHLLAARLGSDVPFFLTGGTALCSGRGEIVQLINGPRPFDLLLHLPGFGLSTPTVYHALAAPPLPTPPDASPVQLASAFDDAPTTTLERLYRNDLEAPALRSEPRLASMLNQGGFHLSGSGSTLFRFCPDPTDESLSEETSGQFVRTVSRTR